MSLLIPILTGLYRCLLNLYPRSFRAEFGEELLDVFEQALKCARKRCQIARGRVERRSHKDCQ